MRRSGIHLWGIDEAVRQDLLERAVRKENLPGVGTAAGQAGTSPGPTGRGPIWTGSLGGHEAVIKIHRHGGGPGWILDRLPGGAETLFPGVSRVCRAARVARGFLGRGGRTAEPLGWLALGHAPFLRLFSATAVVAPACSMEIPLARSEGRARQHLLQALGGAVALWHHAGLHHPDLNLGNILLAGASVGAPGPQDLVVIDLQGARLVSSLGWGRRAAALARMERSALKILGPGAVTDTHRRTLLLAYVLQQARLEKRPRRTAGVFLKRLIPPLRRRRRFFFLHRQGR